jgi:hypothetical protein
MIEAQAREEIVLTCPAPVDDQAAKDYATKSVRATFELIGVTRYVFACEFWLRQGGSSGSVRPSDAGRASSADQKRRQN